MQTETYLEVVGILRDAKLALTANPDDVTIAQEILEYLQDKHHAQWCDEYGEPGYDQPQSGIVFADWNDVPQPLQVALEEVGYNLEWSDEWLICGQGKAWRTSPTSYSWSPSYRVTDDGEIITPDDGALAFIEDCEMTDYGQPIKALPGWVSAEDLEEAGFQRVNEDPYESGWFPGQTDDPAEIARNLFECPHVLKVVFQINEKSQFYIRFTVWVKKENQDD